MKVGDDGLGKRMPRHGQQHIAGGLAPAGVVGRTGGADGGEEERQVVFARQLLHSCRVRAQADQNLIQKLYIFSGKLLFV